MKKAVLVHNPTAGSGNHNKEDLEKLTSKMGYHVKYYSTKSLFWERFRGQEAELIFVAGGDGTVQKLVKTMLEAKDPKLLRVPVQVLPCGTANNIATTLNINENLEFFKKPSGRMDFDIGAVEGVEEVSFFIEGMGCGIFPKLVQVMQSKDENEKQDEIAQSRRELLKVIDSYEAQEAIIIADKEEITGRFLLVELLNIKYIGPNIELAPNAETGDGNFELVMVREDARAKLRDYIEDLLNGRRSGESLQDFADLRKVREVRIKWKGGDVHVDDEIIEDYKGDEIRVKNRQGLLHFLIP